jgi:chemotaxis protein methyltransferase CheR
VFEQHDIRRGAVPSAAGKFALVACRNLAFTYFREDLQHEVLMHLAGALQPGGFLLIGAHERLPRDARGFTSMRYPGFFAKTA